jgi:ribose transport system substrate-binding protein
MKYKRIIIDMFVVAIMLILFINWYNNTVIIPVTALNEVDIYLITMDRRDQFWYTMDQGASDMAELIGVNYIWDAPEERNVDDQIAIINKVVDAGADVIMLAASDPVRVSPAVEDAKARGVRIVYVDAPAVEEGLITLATENYNAGRIAGREMISELEAKGIKGGTIVIIGVTAENITTLNRERGFREVLEQDERFRILDTLYTGGNPLVTENAVLELIEENIDLVGVFATNEGSTLGAGNAIRISYKDIIGIGFDITDEIQNLLRDGVLDVVLIQNPYTMGYLGMAEAVAAIKNYNTGPPFIDTGVSVLTKYQPRRPLEN